MNRAALAPLGACALLFGLHEIARGQEVNTAPPASIAPAKTSLERVLLANALATGKLHPGLSPARRERWSMRFGSMSGTIVYVASGREYREDEILGPDHEARGYDGSTLWSMDANGQVAVGAGIHQSDNVDAAALRSPGHRGVTLLGRTTEPVDAYVVRVQPAGGRLEYRFYDAKSFLLDRVEEIRRDRRVTITFDDYRTTDGLTEPWHVHTSDGFATNDSDRTLQSLEHDVRVDPSELAVPKSTPLITLGTSPVRVPVKMSGDGIVVPVKIGADTVDFFLDSGASGIVVDNAIVEALGIPEHGRVTSETAGIYVESDVVIPSMSAGPLTLHDVHAESLPFTQWTESAPVAGLLGFDFIHDVVWHVDYEHGTLDAIAPAAFVPPVGARALDVTFDDDVPTLSLSIAGVEAPAFVVDTGAYRSMLFSGYVTAHASRLTDEGLGQAMTDAYPFVNDFSGVGGTVDYRPLQTGPLVVGSLSFPAWLFDVAQSSSAFEFQFEDYDGLIGQDFLRNFDLYLDYPDHKIYLVPNDRFRQRWAPG